MPSLSKEQRARLKQDYSGLYETFVWLFADYDFMRLISLGAPGNEYNLEVDVVLSRLSLVKTPEDLQTIIYTAFVECFGETFDTPKKQTSAIVKNRFGTLASEAWHSWKSWEENQKER